MVIRQAYLDKIKPFIGTDLIKIITGIRRSGKSTLLTQIMDLLKSMEISEDQFVYYDLEKEDFSRKLNDEILYQEITTQYKVINKKIYIFLDEIQKVENWEKLVNSLRVNLDSDIYITGSNSQLLSSELSTFLAGRYVQFEIFPFSFKEFSLQYQEVRPLDNLNQAQLFLKYVLFGGMPFLGKLKYEYEPCMQYLQDTYNSVILRDVVSGHKIRDVDSLERLIRFFFKNFANTFSAASIVKYLKSNLKKVTIDTVLNYISFCKDAYILYQVKRDDLKLKSTLSVNEKYYLADHSFYECLYGNSSSVINQILENIVFIELLSRGYKVSVGKVKDKEVDFVATKQSEKIYIQVTYLLASAETVAREFSVFDEIKDNYPKYVLSLDEINLSQNGIIHQNIRDFLLQD